MKKQLRLCALGLVLAACNSAPGFDAATPADATLDTLAPADVTPVDAAPLDAAPEASPADARPEASLPDSPPDVPVDTGPETGRALVFVLNSMTIERSDSATLSGFNLDGIFSNPDGTTARSCDHGDVSSAIDFDQNCPVAMVGADGHCASASVTCTPSASCRGGVDNQLPTIADTVQAAAMMDVRAETSRRINASELAYILRITGVDDTTNDPSVTVRVYQAFPTFSTGCTSVLADRMYVVSQDSLTPGATSIDQSLFTVPARIVAGRLVPTSGGVLQLPVAPGVNVAVNGTLLRATVSDAALSAGNLGGYASGSAFYDAIVAMQPGLATVAASLVGGFVDLEQPLPTPGSSPGLCQNTAAHPPRFGNVGIGALFTAVRAQVSDTPAAARPAGACGGT